VLEIPYADNTKNRCDLTRRFYICVFYSNCF